MYDVILAIALGATALSSILFGIDSYRDMQGCKQMKEIEFAGMASVFIAVSAWLWFLAI